MTQDEKVQIVADYFKEIFDISTSRTTEGTLVLNFGDLYFEIFPEMTRDEVVTFYEKLAKAISEILAIKIAKITMPEDSGGEGYLN